MIKAIIVEDSRLARLELKSQLEEISDIYCVAEAESVEQALEVYEVHKPDIVFLDINLPDGSGFDFLAQLAQAPHVIFTTAFDEFALKAFDQDAIDYLLKPYTQKRLGQACDKFKLINANEHNKVPVDPNSLMTLGSQFFVKDGKSCWLIKLDQVERFEAMGNYTRVYFEDKKPMIYRTLAQIEPRLPSDSFFRISRQNIVQLNKIVNITPCSSGGLELMLKSGAIAEVSRRQASVFKSMLAL
ncbi:LytR/AlgR family response regulator transcription factor [Pseudoalteromonas sp. H105]|uniref:LytR/AlgR family response regulator transcription factor n=2 Tax=Pseudoalteromonas sp. H105 TaxID=1348393 RepID=UPI000731F56A|nr:LytTR family DNA-binding domain-containing protein [Pseudoalteromonas sp. H105]KTF12335.1 two-component system response regulator [Pseudoalteromonas sp. H105]